ncbi:MAG: hypothetical protein C0625_15890 [Arcobacter sp.]|nr:MAG: hypothetical protein C0625_15890 [Arcobacter sp.]
MTVSLEDDNIFKWGHAFCYVVDPEKEGQTISELKRYLEVLDIKKGYEANKIGKCTAILNIDEPRPEELDQIRWTVEGREESVYNSKEIIKHDLKKENVHEINFTAYIDGKPENAANAYLNFDERKKEKEEETNPETLIVKKETEEIVELYYITRTKEFVALTQEESDELKEEEDEIHNLIKPLLDKENDSNIDEINKVKEELHKKLEKYKIKPGTNTLTEIRRVSGNKFTYIRSEKMKNHFRRYSMQADDKKRSKVRTGGELDLKKLKKELTQVDKNAKIEAKWATKFDDTKFGKWVNTFSDEIIADYYTEEEKQTKEYKERMFDASAGAQWMRYAGGASAKASFSDFKKGKISGNLEANSRFALGQAQVKVASYLPDAQGFQVKLPNIATKDDLDFGYFKLELECILSGFAGACAAIDVGVNFDVKDDVLKISTKEDNEKTKREKEKEIGKLRGEVFAGVSAEAEVSGKALWKNPEKYDEFSIIAKIGYGVKGALGLGAEGEFKIDFQDGKFILRAKAGLVYGAGASGKVGFMVDAKTIVHMAQFVYHLLMKADYRTLDCIASRAFYALSSYLVESIADAVELAEEEWEKLTKWWSSKEQAMKKAKALAKSINKGLKDDLLSISTPEAKGKMLAILCVTEYFDDEEEQEKAIIKVLTYIQSKNEARNVFKSISLKGRRIDKSEGEEKLHDILDWYKYDGEKAFKEWWSILPELPPRIDQKVLALNTTILNDYNIIPLNNRRTVNV